MDLAFTARMEDELDEVARGEREWVPLLREFFDAAQDARRREAQGAQARATSRPRRPTRCAPRATRWSIRLGRNGKFLACSLYPEHKETRPLPGEEAPKLEGDGEPCPQCGEGTLATKRGRFGAFVGCSRYPDCTYIRKDGPPPPDQLPFEVTCPKNADGHLVARRARRTGNVFWGCSNYPKCDFTSNDQPTGAIHDIHDRRQGRDRRAAARPGLCMTCGAEVPLPGRRRSPGSRLPGGPPNPAALERPARGGGGAAAAARTGGGRRSTRAEGCAAVGGLVPARLRVSVGAGVRDRPPRRAGHERRGRRRAAAGSCAPSRRATPRPTPSARTRRP